MTTLMQEISVERSPHAITSKMKHPQEVCASESVNSRTLSKLDNVDHLYPRSTRLGYSGNSHNDVSLSVGRLSGQDSASNFFNGYWLIRFRYPLSSKTDIKLETLLTKLSIISNDETVFLVYDSNEGLVVSGTKDGFDIIESLFRQHQLSSLLDILVDGLCLTFDVPKKINFTKKISLFNKDFFAQYLPEKYPEKYREPSIIGIKSNADRPGNVGWTIGHGNELLSPDQLNQEQYKLVDYFATSLAFPEVDIWVNLSPFQPQKILPKGLENTRLGCDFIAQDCELKKYIASLVNPSHPLGREYWIAISDRSFEITQSLQRTISLFQKVWVFPSNLEYYKRLANQTELSPVIRKYVDEDEDCLFLTKSNIKVECSADNLALRQYWRKHFPASILPQSVKDLNQNCLEIFREIILPEVVREVNEGRRFGVMRQILSSTIMASFFKIHFGDRLENFSFIDTKNPDKFLKYISKYWGIKEPSEIFPYFGMSDGLKQTKELYRDYVQLFNDKGYRMIQGQFDENDHPLLVKTYYSGGISGMIEN